MGQQIRCVCGSVVNVKDHVDVSVSTESAVKPYYLKHLRKWNLKTLLLYKHL